jgi:hypothetical protein
MGKLRRFHLRAGLFRVTSWSDMAQPTAEIMADRLKKLEDRVNTLESRSADDASKRLELFAGEHALREALLQFTQEVAARDGFSVEVFVSRFEKAIDWHRDRFLRMLEGVDPQMAAHIDTRNFTDVPTEAQPPCIFPD